MLFVKYPRDAIRSGGITSSARVSHWPRVTVGKRYRMEEGEIEADSIVPISDELPNVLRNERAQASATWLSNANVR